MLLASVWRNLVRQRVRSTLTVLGVAIGVIALVAVGALSEQLARIIAHSRLVERGVVLTFIRPSARQNTAALRVSLTRIAGVSHVLPEVVLPYAFGPAARDNFGPPSLIFGLPPEAASRVLASLTLARGRSLGPNDRRNVAVGSDFARREDTGIGDTVALYGSSYRVVGIYQKSFTIFDNGVFVSFEDAQALLHQALPAQYSEGSHRGALATTFALVLLPDTDASLVAARANLIDGIQARDPKALEAGLATTTSIFDAIVYGAATIALVIGALSIVNTMTTAVRERTREIGIRKAIGASDAAILWEFFVESALIGALGGLAGVLAGVVLCSYFDSRSTANGSLELFNVTPLVAIRSFVLAVMLGALSGIAPAWNAARLEPTEALRRL
ncbi:MAG: ABC transporter permease [Vulcanimicrobiaceae bacterium]